MTIVNLSPRDLVIEGIDVIDDGTNRNPLVRLIPRGGAATGFRDAVTLEFDLRLGVVAPSYVDIEQRAATVQRLVIAGLIDNPIGLTRLINLNGPIVANAGSRIITNLLDAYAPSTTAGSIGSASGRLTVDLVQYRAFPSLIDPVGGVFEPRIVVEAGVDAYLSLRGVDRYNSFTGSMTTAAGSLTRSTGTWSADGFVVGDIIVVFGLSGGQRTYRVTSVSATVLGLTTVPGGGAAPTAGTATLSVVRTAPMAITIDNIVAGRDVNIELRTTVRQPGSASAGVVDVHVVNEAAGVPFSWANPKPHISHFRGPISSDPLVYDPRRTGFAGSAGGNGTTTTGAEVAIDGNYTIHLRNPVAARVTEPFNGAVRFVPTPVPGGPRFTIFTTATTPRTAPGITAGRHVSIKDTEGLNDASGLAPDSGSPQRISLTGFIQMGDTTPGWLDVNVDGRVDLEEVSGDLRVGLVRSRTDDVRLVAVGSSILDGNPADPVVLDPQDVEGVNIALGASERIGTQEDFLEINLLDVVNGVVVAGRLNANADIAAYLEEVAGDLRVWFVSAAFGDPAAVTDLALVSRTGSITDAQADNENDLYANRIDLAAGCRSVRSPTPWRSTRRRRDAAPGGSTPRPGPAFTSWRRSTSSSCWLRRRCRAMSSSP